MSSNKGIIRVVKYTYLVCITGFLFNGCNGNEGICEKGYLRYNSECYKEFFEIQISTSNMIDIIFVMDNSMSMVAEQIQLAESFYILKNRLEGKFDEYHIAVITTGMESEYCPKCDSVMTLSCVNETNETGHFQDRIGKNIGTVDNPLFTFRTESNCKVVNQDNQRCLYDEVEKEGTLLVGVSGCVYERGLAPVEIALTNLLDTYNLGFLREDATLGVIIVSDEEDCGRVGDVSEGIPPLGNICYFASKGVGPEGETVHPQDPGKKQYALTSVDSFYQALLNIKGGREGMIKFAALVGVKDLLDLSSTTIEYEFNSSRNIWEVKDACNTPGCSGSYCFAKPGTRYIRMAQMFGVGRNGFVDTICQDDFSNTMAKLGEFLSCQDAIFLQDKPASPGSLLMLFNGEEVPRYACEGGTHRECTGQTDGSCPGGDACLETWLYSPPSDPPDPMAPGGTISFAAHYNPCQLFKGTGPVLIEIIDSSDSGS